MKTFAEQEFTIDLERKVLQTCINWPLTKSNDDRVELHDFITLYKDQIQQLDLLYGIAGETWPFAEKHHHQVLEIVRELRMLGVNKTKNDARQAIMKQSQLVNLDVRNTNLLIDAALRTWTLINFRSLDDHSVGRGRPCIQWNEEVTFQKTFDDLFPLSETELTLSQRRLSPHFTVANMVDICGLKVDWATTLDDHLSLDPQHKTLRIFPLRAWLHIQTEPAVGSKSSHLVSTGQPTPIQHAPLPKELYEETSRTLDLLFPSWDTKTQNCLKKRGKDFHSKYYRSRLLDLKHYPYWKDRLLELNEDIFLAPPQGWSQLWRDRRDPQKFWTFWIALLVLLLAIVSTVATIIQTWATLVKTG